MGHVCINYMGFVIAHNGCLSLRLNDVFVNVFVYFLDIKDV